VQLYFYYERYINEVKDYHLTEEQLRFTGTPKVCIELSYDDCDRFSILAMEEDKLVTFFVLHKNQGVIPYSDNHNSILLRSFSTDSRYQGKGYAKKALMQLSAFIRENFSDINEVVLAVNIKNETAQGLYRKCGFVDEGIRRMGKKGELIIMGYYL
jgi:RimJ/RimL family protein N-acetyltransferase